MCKNLKKLLIFSLLSFLSVLLVCCEYLANQKPEFCIANPVYKSGEIDGICKLGGVFFDFYNKSAYSVQFLEIRMNIYDKNTGKEAFIGTGTIVSEMECNIESGEKRKLCIPLDQYMVVCPLKDCIIDQFYISKIKFSDGREWHDILGLYSTSN